MKHALTNQGLYDEYRSEEIRKIIAAVNKYGISISGKAILDMGCNDGAITSNYIELGASEAIGVDIDDCAIRFAQEHRTLKNLTFRSSTTTSLPVADDLIDLIISYDVFEHVSQPDRMLDECWRVLKPGGKVLIGTWGWHHPFAPHLWSTLPVPWAHIFFSEKTMLRTCQRVYESPWYVPNMHDLDETGEKLQNRYSNESISEDYLNKLLIKDFEELFEESRFAFSVYPEPFGSKYAGWTKVFLNTPWIREFITSYIWVVLTK
ncbi:methyltransferase domain-containing protein [bacterium]|nr:methyltransferase domain-containing protein [bacterium]